MRIKLLSDNATVPTRGSIYSAGFDLYAAEDVSIEPGKTVKVKTDIAIEIPPGYFGGVYARSGISTKRGLRPANCTGVVDSDYRGNVIVALHNDSDIIQDVVIGERIAQLIIQPYEQFELTVSEILSDSDRGEGGFGSTGTR